MTATPLNKISFLRVLKFSSIGLATVFMVGLTEADSGQKAAPEIVISEVMQGLESPWDLAFTETGDMFFTERCAGLSVKTKAGEVIHLFGTMGSTLVAEDLFCEGQSGMGGVALDPDFKTNKVLYVYMSSNLTSPRTNRVVKLTLGSDYEADITREDIVQDIAYKNIANTWGQPGSHSGSRLRFGPDGYLYITTGDNHNGPLPQDLTLLGGKILRVDRAGNAAPDNAPPAGADSRIFTYGHRNPQGLTFHPTTGQPFIAEHGPGHSDEVTALINGGNGGWDPKPEPGVTCADNYCGYISNKPSGEPTPMTDLEKFPQAMKPVWVLADSQGMGPASFITGEQWQDWNGTLFVGVMAAGKVYSLKLKDNGDLDKTTEVPLPKARFRSIVQGPEGAIYYCTDEGFIMKVDVK